MLLGRVALRMGIRGGNVGSRLHCGIGAGFALLVADGLVGLGEDGIDNRDGTPALFVAQDIGSPSHFGRAHHGKKWVILRRPRKHGGCLARMGDGKTRHHDRIRIDDAD
ncbi:hypothetical protein LP419_14355 [Massilia sp. H-1]|nr:hypothetical protein LP419_14355 [Massilia sp. H-1]